MNYKEFFNRKSEEVAIDLIGRLLVRTTEKGITSGRIIQTGAYEEGSETMARQGMKNSPGTIFLMPYRGSYLLNIATDKPGYQSCVEIRQIAFHDKIIGGSGRISNYLDIDQNLDGILLGEELQILGNSVEKSKIKKIRGYPDNCLGYFLMK